MRGIVYGLLLCVLTSCSFLGSGERRRQLEAMVKRESVLATLEHLEKTLPEGRAFYAGIGAPTFENGSRFRVKKHEVKYSGVEQDLKSNKGVYAVLARVVFVQGRRSEKVNIKYTFLPTPRSKKKVRIRFIYGFPGDTYLTRNDPLKKFRKSRWLSAIKKRKLVAGMPEEALLLAWGQPLSNQSSASAFGVKKVLGYGGHEVTLLNGKVDRWKRIKK